MRAPTITLIRARAKAPLSDLEVLHLSDAGIEVIQNVDACQQLRSLYADGNRLASADGIAELPKLWRVDLSGNRLRDVSALTAFRALGFLHLERNQLTLGQVACLRGMHIMELRLAGNPSIAGSDGGELGQEYRRKVVALLPNVWILDGHFVSAMERGQAIEQYETHVLAVLSPPLGNDAPDSSSSSSSSGGGIVVSASIAKPSACPLWAGSGSNAFGIADQHENAEKMLSALREEPGRRLLQDLYRLRLIIGFHNEEAAVHNAHAQFATHKRALNARTMPLVFLDAIQRLPRSTRLAVTVLLVAYLHFRFDHALLVEALTIQLLECEGVSSQVVDDTASLPPYALLAITSILRHQAIEEEGCIRRANLPEASSPAFEDACEVWRSLPPVVQTLLLGTRRDFDGPEDRLESEDRTGSGASEDPSIWCRRAVQLLSTASLFPELDGPANSKKGSPSSLSSIIALHHAATSGSQISHLDTMGTPSFSVTVSKVDQREWRRNQQALDRPYLRPWAVADGDKRRLNESQSAPLLEVGHPDTSTASSITTSGQRRPRQGEWLEVRPDLFLKILHASADGAFVSAAPMSKPSDVITVAAHQLTRKSGNAWRIAQSERADELLAAMSAQTPVNSLVGKLHRDSEGFHRHGAARNQGFPNYDVRTQHVAEAGIGGALGCTGQARPVGLFASSDTLDANYVLASPLAIAAQNFCASKGFAERRLAPAGLWRPIERVSARHVAAPSGSLELPPCPKRAASRGQSVASPMSFEPPSDWDDIRRQLRSVLGIPSPRPTSTGGDDCAAVPLTSPAEPAPTSRTASGLPLARAASQPRLRPLCASWHAVPTQPGFLVASQVPQAPAIPRRAAPAAAPRAVLKLRECNLPLPSLSPSLDRCV